MFFKICTAANTLQGHSDALTIRSVRLLALNQERALGRLSLPCLPDAITDEVLRTASERGGGHPALSASCLSAGGSFLP